MFTSKSASTPMLSYVGIADRTDQANVSQEMFVSIRNVFVQFGTSTAWERVRD